MKIIGQTIHDSQTAYVAIITKSEIEKVFNKFYRDKVEINIGDDVKISEGHDFSRDISMTCESMLKAMKDFEKARDTLIRFANMVLVVEKEKDERYD